jgi:hypothetical protein
VRFLLLFLERLKKRKNFYKGAIMRFISELSFFAFPKGRFLLGFLAVLLTFPACQNPTGDSSTAEKTRTHITASGNAFAVARVGHILRPADLTVTAHYSDGSTSTLNWGEYTTDFEEKNWRPSPNTSGENITVRDSYGNSGTMSVKIEPLKFQEVSSLNINKPVTAVAYGKGENGQSKWSWIARISPNSSSDSLYGFLGDNLTGNSTGNSTEPSHIVNDIAFGNGMYIAVGGLNYTSIYSSTGTQWNTYQPISSSDLTSITLPLNSFQLNAVAFGGNNRFVAVGNNGLIVRSSPVTGSAQSSSSSPSWEAEINIPPFDGNTNINCIVYGDKFVIGGPSGKMAYSADGWQWTPSYSFGEIRGIAYGKNKYVMITKTSETTSMIAYSSNGIDWSIVTGLLSDSRFAGLVFEGLTYGDGLFVAYGQKNSNQTEIAYSVDGLQWSLVGSNDKGGFGEVQIRDIAYGENGMFVIVGGNDDEGKVAYSNPSGNS